MRRQLWAIPIGLMWLAAACQGGSSSSTGPSAVTLDAKPRRTVSVTCTGVADASVHIDFLSDGILGHTVVGTVDLGAFGSGIGGCGQSMTVSGLGKANAFTGSEVTTGPLGGGDFANVLPGKGITDNLGALTVTIK